MLEGMMPKVVLWLVAAATLTCLLYTLLLPFLRPNATLANTSLDVAGFVSKTGFGFLVMRAGGEKLWAGLSKLTAAAGASAAGRKGT
jgi:hypothetical protein